MIADEKSLDLDPTPFLSFSIEKFPLAPLLTDSPSADDPALAKLSHPDPAETLAFIDEDGASLPPMRLRPGAQVASVMWAQEFRGAAVDLAELEFGPEPAREGKTVLAERAVTTSRR